MRPAGTVNKRHVRRASSANRRFLSSVCVVAEGTCQTIFPPPSPEIKCKCATMTGDTGGKTDAAGERESERERETRVQSWGTGIFHMALGLGLDTGDHSARFKRISCGEAGEAGWGRRASRPCSPHRSWCCRPRREGGKSGALRGRAGERCRPRDDRTRFACLR